MTSRLVALLLVIVAVGAAWVVASDDGARRGDTPAIVEADVPPSVPVAPEVVVAPAARPREVGVRDADPPAVTADRAASLDADIDAEVDEELVARGWVLSPTGRPVHGALVSIRAQLVVAPGRRPEQRSYSTTSDASGRFEMTDDVSIASVRIQAHGKRHAASPVVESPVGGVEVDLVLRRPSSVHGVVLPGDDLAFDDVTVALEPTRETQRAQLSWSVSQSGLGDDGTYRFGGLAPGAYEVHVRAKDVFAWDSLAVAGPIDVGEGVDVSAPTIDLAMSFRAFRVEVVDELGAPIERGTGTYWSPTHRATSDLSIEDGVSIVRTRHDSVVAWFGAPGRRAVEVPELAGDARVVLGPKLRARVRLAAPSLTPRAPYRLSLRPYAGLGTDNWVLATLVDHPTVEFDERGEALLELAVARPHRYSLFLTGPRVGADGDPVVVNLSSQSGELDVRDVGGEQVFEIDVDPAVLAEALESLDV